MGAPLNVQQKTQNTPEDRSPSAHLVPRWLVEKREGRKGLENDREMSLRTEGLVRSDWERPLQIIRRDLYAHLGESTMCDGCTEAVFYTLSSQTDIPSRPSLPKPNPWQALTLSHLL